MDESGYPKSKYYKIRKLEYKDNVVIEQMVRTSDCDSDDTILSIRFKKGEVPSDWKIEVTIDDNA